jgi:hypothetical protein
LKHASAFACVAALTIMVPFGVWGQNAELQNNEKQLVSIEALFGQLEAAKTDDERDKYSDNLDSSLAAYAKAMVASFYAGVDQAKLAAKTGNKEGDLAAVKSFEDLAHGHADRLDSLDSQAQKLLPKAGSITEPASGNKVFGWAMLEDLRDFFVSPADAAIAIPVIAACQGSTVNPVACAAAISTSVTQAAAAQATYNNCWNAQANVKPKWWRAVKRAVCVAALVARLA